MNKYDHKKNESNLHDHGYSHLKNSSGMSNGSETIKPSESGQSWKSDKGRTFSTSSELSDYLKNNKK